VLSISRFLRARRAECGTVENEERGKSYYSFSNIKLNETVPTIHKISLSPD
jgi:hypothetical protein